MFPNDIMNKKPQVLQQLLLRTEKIIFDQTLFNVLNKAFLLFSLMISLGRNKKQTMRQFNLHFLCFVCKTSE